MRMDSESKSKAWVSNGRRLVLVAWLAILASCGGGGDGPGSRSYSDQEVLALIGQLTSSDPSFTTNSAPYRTLLDIGERAMPLLVQTLRDPSRHTDVRKWCARLIGNVGAFEEAYDILLSVLHDRSGLYQWWHVAEASSGLRELFGRQPAALATTYFSNADPEVRSAAIASFSYRPGFTRDAGFMNLLTDRLLADADSGVRYWAAIVLEQYVVATDPIAPFVAALSDGSSLVRAHAAGALGKIRNRDALADLVRALEFDTDEWVRAAAVDALGAIGDSSALPALRRAAAEDPSPFVRDHASRAVDLIERG